MSGTKDLDKELVSLLAKVKISKTFIASVYQAMNTKAKKEQMIEYLKKNGNLKMSDVYLKEMQINEKIIV